MMPANISVVVRGKKMKLENLSRERCRRLPIVRLGKVAGVMTALLVSSVVLADSESTVTELGEPITIIQTITPEYKYAQKKVSIEPELRYCKNAEGKDVDLSEANIIGFSVAYKECPATVNGEPCEPVQIVRASYNGWLNDMDGLVLKLIGSRFEFLFAEKDHIPAPKLQARYTVLLNARPDYKTCQSAVYWNYIPKNGKEKDATACSIEKLPAGAFKC
jgi:hypothetical protein